MSVFPSVTRIILDRIASGRYESDIFGALRDTLLPRLISDEVQVSEVEEFVGDLFDVRS
jgi:hypothetical protein